MSLCVHMNAGYYIFGGGRPKARQPVKLPTTEEEVGGGSLCGTPAEKELTSKHVSAASESPFVRFRSAIVNSTDSNPNLIYFLGDKV